MAKTVYETSTTFSESLVMARHAFVDQVGRLGLAGAFTEASFRELDESMRAYVHAAMAYWNIAPHSAIGHIDVARFAFAQRVLRGGDYAMQTDLGPRMDEAYD